MKQILKKTGFFLGVIFILTMLTAPLTRHMIANAATSLWVASGGNIRNTNSGKVEIGGGTNQLALDVYGKGEATSSTNTGIIEVGNSLRLDKDEIITNSGTTLKLQDGNNSDLWVDNGTLAVDTSSNSVGIGTKNPASRLHVYENGANTKSPTVLTIEQNGSYDARINFLLTGSTRWVMGVDNSDADKFVLGKGANWGEGKYITLQTNGDICIGNC